MILLTKSQKDLRAKLHILVVPTRFVLKGGPLKSYLRLFSGSLYTFFKDDFLMVSFRMMMTRDRK